MFAGGGTGGHLYPAIALADEVKKQRPEADVLFVGTKGRIESRVVPDRGYPFASIRVTGLQRRVSLRTLMFPLTLMIAMVQSFVLIRKFRPDVVVGTGGYVCGPPVFVATLLGIPTLIQEQNSYPGVTTRILAKRVNEVHITFEGSRRYFKRTDNVKLSGNPVRVAIGTISREEGARFFGVSAGQRILLVAGGSLGAASINRAVLTIVPDLASAGVQILWATGVQDHAAIEQAVGAFTAGVRGLVHLQPYIENMEYALGACDLAVCRSGATTLAELMQAGVPSILVPYPHAAADHQTENARAMVNQGAAVMCRDSDLKLALLLTIKDLLGSPERLRAMSAHARDMSKPHAAEALAGALLHLAKA